MQNGLSSEFGLHVRCKVNCLRPLACVPPLAVAGHTHTRVRRLLTCLCSSSVAPHKNPSSAENTCCLSSPRRCRTLERTRRGRMCPQLFNPAPLPHHHHHHLASRRPLLHSATADIFSLFSVQPCQQTASTACLWRLVVSLPVHGYGQSTQSAEGTRSARS